MLGFEVCSCFVTVCSPWTCKWNSVVESFVSVCVSAMRWRLVEGKACVHTISLETVQVWKTVADVKLSISTCAEWQLIVLMLVLVWDCDMGLIEQGRLQSQHWPVGLVPLWLIDQSNLSLNQSHWLVVLLLLLVTGQVRLWSRCWRCLNIRKLCVQLLPQWFLVEALLKPL